MIPFHRESEPKRALSYGAMPLYGLCARYGAIAASGNSQSTMSELRQKETGVALQPLFLFGGDEGNRTPVRKSIHTTFFVDSLLFKIPVGEREQTRFPHW